jgi:hypothetical protein
VTLTLDDLTRRLSGVSVSLAQHELVGSPTERVGKKPDGIEVDVRIVTSRLTSTRAIEIPHGQLWSSDHMTERSI